MSEPTKPRNKKGAAQKSITLRLSEMRLKKMKKQVEKLTLELQKTKGTHVNFDAMKREVLAANANVRAKLDALPSRLALQVSGATPAEAERLMRSAIREALMELAYEQERATEADGKPKRTAKKGA